MTAKLISAFVFATQIVQSLYFLNLEFQASSYLLWLYSPVCVGPGWKPWTGFLTTCLISGLTLQGIILPGIRKWPGPAFAFHTWLCLDATVDTSLHDLQPEQPYRRQIYRLVYCTQPWLSLDSTVDTSLHDLQPEQPYRRQIYRLALGFRI